VTDRTAEQTRLDRIRSLGRAGFARASEEPYRRRPVDATLVVLALVLLVLCAFHEGDPAPIELHIVELASDLPADVYGFFVVLFGLGALWAVALVGLAAVAARRWRLARDLVLAGFTAWFLGRLLGAFVDTSSATAAFRAVVEDASTPRFPCVPVAVVVAVVAAASPYLTRPVRRLGLVVVVLDLVGAMAIGAGYPNDVVAGLALGLVVAGAYHLALGSPGGRPTMAQIDLALAELGVDADDVTLAPVQHVGRTAVTATTPSGPVEITVIGRDERDARLFAKAFRFAFYRDSGPDRFRSRLQEVEHEAYVLLLAARGGARVPEMVETGLAGPDAALLVVREVSGPTLTERGSATTDAELDAVWEQIARLRASRVALGGVDTDHVLLAPDGPTLVGFTSASSAAPESRLAADVAALLVTTAELVGPERAVAAARRGLGDEVLTTTAPYLQTGILTRRGRALVHDAGAAMTGVRGEVVHQLGIDEPRIEELRRVTPGQIVTFGLTIFGVWALLGVIGNPVELWNTIKSANWWYVLGGFVLWGVTNITYAIAALGGLPPSADVPLGQLTIVQSAGSFLNLATPGGVGTMLMNIRFLQKRGIPPPTAIASGTLPTIGYTAVQFFLLFVTGKAVADTVSLGDLGIDPNVSGGTDVGAAAVVVVIVALVAGIVLLIPKIRHKVIPPIVTTAKNVWSVITSPRKLALIVGGGFATQMINATILALSLAAFGVHVPLSQLIFVNTAVSLFASVIPVPGGMGVVEAGLTAGLTALGVDPSVASAAVLTDRLVTAYIPPIIGWVSLRWLQQRDLV
jgi:uncharacterized membrane protein YbhN (UPF0104 family)